MFNFSPRFALLPSAALAIMLGLTACGGGSDTPAPAGATPAPGGQTPAPTPIDPAPIDPAPIDPAPAAAINITGLVDYRATGGGNRLVNFVASTASNAATPVAITGLVGNDTVIGIDRNTNGIYWAFARAAAAPGGAPNGAAAIYVINPVSGVASGRLPVTFPAGVTLDGSTSVSVDFNPTNNLMRVVTFLGRSLAINTGTAAATENPNTGFGSAAVAYGNNVAGATTTTLYRINNNGSTASPPPDQLSTSAIATGATTNVGPIGLDLVEVQAFDISGANDVNALAALRTSGAGAHTLYRINLTNGTATLFNATAAASLIGGTTGLPLVDITIRP